MPTSITNSIKITIKYGKNTLKHCSQFRARYSSGATRINCKKKRNKHTAQHSRRRRGGAGGAVAPPFGSKRRKSSKIRANGLFIWANSLDIWAHHCQNIPSQIRWRPFFFFFFLEHFHLDRKTVQILGMTFFFYFFGEHLNLGRKNRLNFDRETQCIKSFFGQKFAAPPKSSWAPTAMQRSIQSLCHKLCCNAFQANSM